MDTATSTNQNNSLKKGEKRLFATTKRGKLKKFLESNIMVISIFISIAIGFSIGIALKMTNMKDSQLSSWLVLPGKLFLRSLKLFILPVIFFGVLTATSSLNTKTNAKLTIVCFAFVMLTHVIACTLSIGGSFIFLTFKTQKTVENNLNSNTKLRDLSTQKTFYDIFVDIFNNLIPKNIIKASMYQELTQYETINNPSIQNNNTNLTTIRNRKIIEIADTNVLGILSFAILIGMAAGSIGTKGEPFRLLIQSINHVVMTSLKWVIKFGPIGFTSLIIEAVLDMNDLEKNLKELGLFALIVTLFCLIYGVVILSFICFIFIRKNPLKYYFYFVDPMILAFASTSGAVCIHESIENCDTKLHLNPILSRFCLPFYTALQSDGSAIFITMSTIFLAYFNNYTLSFSDYLIILIMTSVLCLSLPSVPSSSLITIIVVLGSINLNVNIAPLYACEWILDRVRTTVNVYSHCICTVITEKLFRNKNLDLKHLNGYKLANNCDQTDDDGLDDGEIVSKL